MTSRILSLPTEVVDQIAAGEVVERPSHLVKELVENSIDAGSDEISIEFSEGGRQVKVSDNGSGIHAEDLRKSLERHATSKIKISDDLWKLSSFGFRGEALASISAVSKLSIVSKTKNSKTATRLVSEFGTQRDLESVGGSNGTSILVEDLFANVPARLKFMKSAAAEGTQIKNTLKALAFSYPQCEFKIMQDNELVFFWPKAESRLIRAKQILGIEKLFEGSAEREGVKAYSIFADPHNTAKTQRQIWLFAQNRWIQDRGLQAAVMEAYRSLLMHGEYPICITWVETEPEKIDVNIHPTKSQVKFLDSSLAFRAVQASVRSTLEKAPWLEMGDAVADAVENYSLKNLVHQNFENLQFSAGEMNRTHYQQKTAPLFHEPQTVAIPPSSVQSFERKYLPIQSSEETKIGYWSSLQVLGQANLTYILAQSASALVMVDQHAAHERVLYEKFMTTWKSGTVEVQDFLFPLSIDLSPEKAEALLYYQKDLSRLGVSLESLGPATVGVKAAPLLLKDKALAMVLEQMASEVVELGGSYSLERKVGDICASLACHSAIRAGQALSQQEMQALLSSMDESSMSSFCPHGRPVQVEYPFYKLEKDFGRIT